MKIFLFIMWLISLILFMLLYDGISDSKSTEETKQIKKAYNYIKTTKNTRIILLFPNNLISENQKKVEIFLLVDHIEYYIGKIESSSVNNTFDITSQINSLKNSPKCAKIVIKTDNMNEVLSKSVYYEIYFQNK